MSIGLSGDPHYFHRSKEQEYYEFLLFSYYRSERISLVRKIRNATTEEEAIKIYNQGIQGITKPMSPENFKGLPVEEQRITIKNLQQKLCSMGIHYPNPKESSF